MLYCIYTNGVRANLMHHNNALCLDLLYRKRSYSDQHIRDLEYFCGSVQRPHVRGPMSPDVVALVVLVSDGWVELIGSSGSGAPHSRLERVGRRAPTRPTPVSFRPLPAPLSCVLLASRDQLTPTFHLSLLPRLLPSGSKVPLRPGLRRRQGL